MELCEECGNPLDEAGFTNCRIKGVKCARDRTGFADAVEKAREATSLETVSRIASNGMPACFEPTRAGFVALGQLLLNALNQNQDMLDRMKALNERLQKAVKTG